jgi:hypothetical protein
MLKLLKNRYLIIFICLVILTCCVALLSGVTVFQMKYPMVILVLFFLIIVVVDLIL